ncbi:MAG TPA: ABC transporter permease [candidate division Zixibacteria bacterium]|nr:ABC transporter permease [candidate division Zixibacteria bacterium]
MVGRTLRYLALRAISLFLTVVAGVYISILVANMGGYVDQIRRAQIREQVGTAALGDRNLRQLPPAEVRRIIDERVALEERRLGLDRPFLLRSFDYLADALTLSLGRAERLTSDRGSRQVRAIILERLPATLLLFGTADLIVFVLAITVALSLSRRYGSLADRMVVALAPTSAAPAWFYGIFLILVFASMFRLLPFGGMVAVPPPESPLAYAFSVARHLVLPLAAVLLGSLFVSIYNWRTFFLIYSSEDYVEVAKAKGLPSAAIERRYILRPTLPPIITSFAFTLISLWSGAIILETVFSWPGLGRLLFQAVGQFDTPVIIGSVVIYAYLLALTVFLLDILYALVDPRVKVGGGAGGSP